MRGGARCGVGSEVRVQVLRGIFRRIFAARLLFFIISFSFLIAKKFSFFLVFLFDCQDEDDEGGFAIYVPADRRRRGDKFSAFSLVQFLFFLEFSRGVKRKQSDLGFSLGHVAVWITFSSEFSRSPSPSIRRVSGRFGSNFGFRRFAGFGQVSVSFS